MAVKFKNDFFSAAEMINSDLTDWSAGSNGLAVTDFHDVLFHDDWDTVKRGDRFAKITVMVDITKNRIIYSFYESEEDAEDPDCGVNFEIESKLMC